MSNMGHHKMASKTTKCLVCGTCIRSEYTLNKGVGLFYPHDLSLLLEKMILV